VHRYLSQKEDETVPGLGGKLFQAFPQHIQIIKITSWRGKRYPQEGHKKERCYQRSVGTYTEELIKHLRTISTQWQIAGVGQQPWVSIGESEWTT